MISDIPGYSRVRFILILGKGMLSSLLGVAESCRIFWICVVLGGLGCRTQKKAVYHEKEPVNTFAYHS